MSKRFQFRLDPLLNIKNFMVAQAKENLAQIMGYRLRKEDEIAAQQLYYDSLLRNRAETSKAGDLQAIFYHKVSVDHKIKKLEKEKTELLEIEDIKRTALAEAMKEEKILDKLKQKKLIIHNHESNKEETHILDEIAINQHHKLDVIN